MMSEKSVSIIMNCYNGEKYLHYAIDSILSQTHENWELIFWDNQSTDDSAKIFKSYIDSRFKYFYAKKHEVIVSKARNYALSKAKGSFIAFLDVDDVWLPIKLTEQLKFFDLQDVGVVCGNYWVTNERKRKKYLAYRKQFNPTITTNTLLRNYVAALVTLIIRRDVLEKLNYVFDEHYHIIGDFDLILRLSMITKITYIKNPVAVLRLHGNNETNKNINLHWEEVNSWIQLGENIIEINSLDGFKYRKDWYVYTKSLHKILENEKKYAYGALKSLPWGMLKLRLLIAILMPVGIVKKLKN